ncbi:hypothetical protein [Nostoc sp.]|uniref:hypothetical protein n=1 Tax=Nostoc sp. TaxID=1180 RepID=UPI002FFC8825
MWMRFFDLCIHGSLTSEEPRLFAVGFMEIRCFIFLAVSGNASWVGYILAFYDNWLLE